ncbi:MAG: D-lactate dehydrogenase (cytochrome), partial [uncultured bacterium]
RRLTRQTDPPLDWFAASEGTLGIITRLELEIRKLTPMKHFLIVFPDAGKMGRALEAIIHAPVMPYNLHFSDDRCALAMKSLGFSPADGEPAHTLGIDYEGSEEDLRQADDIMTSLTATDQAAHLSSAETAEREWAEKFNALRLKRGGPSVLGSEIWLPVKELPDYLTDIRKMAGRYGPDFISYGHVATPDRVTVMTLFHTDETRTVEYILDLSLVKKIHDAGRRHGGWPYGLGLWNTPYLGRMFTPPQLAERRRRKQELDCRGIMNPGKGYRPPFMLNPFHFEVGMDLLAMARRATGKSRR